MAVYMDRRSAFTSMRTPQKANRKYPKGGERIKRSKSQARAPERREMCSSVARQTVSGCCWARSKRAIKAVE
ncbi:hypothetical protein SADUNF_SadunfUnG0001900 [Salix dunnii]|uniref:Uncharacterized protein n=1 Tax=Salix dunnii TaxID=1413687 RepID=A0A835J2S0_9ROSI|nr:hypothetical protein SADUNF_SadunfUnG0001900 [Salix dunnii]